MNFSRNSPAFSIFIRIKSAFNYLGLNPIACLFLVNNLQQLIKEPSLKYYPFLLRNVSSLIRNRNKSLVESIGDTRKFQFAFRSKITWNYMF